MLIKRLLIISMVFCFVLVVTAQEGDKTLPGEGEAVEEDIDTDVSSSILDDEDLIQEMLIQGDVEITLADLVYDVDFSDSDDWENYEEDTRFVLVDDDVYIAEVEDSNTIWGQNFEDFEDGVIAVVVRQDGGTDDNGIGVMCRANEDNNLEGYHFWISGEGRAAITVYTEDDGYTFLADWEETDAIDTEGENILHVICVAEYLALYVNGELVSETEDDTFDEGQTGLSLRNFDDGATARAIFDNVFIWEASD